MTLYLRRENPYASPYFWLRLYDDLWLNVWCSGSRVEELPARYRSADGWIRPDWIKIL